MKVCYRCKTEKPFEDFYKQSSSKDGLMPCCKKCDNQRKTDYLRLKSIELGHTPRTYTLLARELLKEGKKICPRCKQTKSVDEFYPNAANTAGINCHCILCTNELGKLRPKSERRQRYVRDKVKLRDKLLVRKYGISLNQYENMLKEQGGVCAICGKLPTNKQLAVDHCHKTGKVRGLLCSKCNIGIGFIEDNPVFARKIVDYLEKGN